MQSYMYMYTTGRAGALLCDSFVVARPGSGNGEEDSVGDSQAQGGRWPWRAVAGHDGAPKPARTKFLQEFWWPLYRRIGRSILRQSNSPTPHARTGTDAPVSDEAPT
eukprot:SAG22_NODE_7679_length_718_cov_0.642973_2_plen_106_part_01